MINRQWLFDRGFLGFIREVELRSGRLSELPSTPGVYAVLREREEKPTFLAQSTGGHFKGKNPTVSISLLQQAWIPECQVVYIGKAGGIDKGPSLQKRVRQYLDFGAGKAVGHRGGRYIWQLGDASELIFAWRPTAGVEPRKVERELIAEIESTTGKLPFANLQR